MNKITKIFFISLLLYTLQTLFALSSFAQLVPDFRVNDDTTNYSQYKAKVGTDNKGNFVIVWYDQRSGNLRLRGQIFDSNANRIGKSFQINNDIYTTNPSLSVRGDGSFAVSWNVISLKFRIFNNLGYPITDEIILEDTVAGFVNALGCDTSGNFIVIFNQDSSTINNLYYQKLNQYGKKVGSKIIVSDVTTLSTYQGIAINVRKDGSFIITWNDKRPPAGSDADDIYFQMFDQFGNRIGVNQKVNDDISTSNQQIFPKISSDTTNKFIIAWHDNRESFNSTQFYAQNYLSTGVKEGINFRLYSSSSKIGALQLVKKEDGKYLVGWDEDLGSVSTLYFQRYDSSNIKIGLKKIVSTQSLSTSKIYSDIRIFNDKIISVWNDERNGPFDVYCNIRSFSNPDTTVNVIQISSLVPENFSLDQNYPNPFNSTTLLSFDIKKSDIYKFEIFNNLGQSLNEIFHKNFNPGTYQINLESSGLSSGIYYYILSSPMERFVKSFVLLK
ncbi:MAG: T9SS type A sorting domain-containing protein [Ignavibacteria bacterium]|nr:T9SS type A sorting domain-containing protein [Ignavibacteria bacterium]